MANFSCKIANFDFFNSIRPVIFAFSKRKRTFFELKSGFIYIDRLPKGFFPEPKNPIADDESIGQKRKIIKNNPQTHRI
jgi:hypothetical protein